MASCLAKARGCWRWSSKSAPARAARASTPRSTAMRRPATPTTACRWIRTASRSCAACNEAVAKSGRAPEEIGYINYHGTSTQLNDVIESRCTRAAFGALAEKIPGSSTKSMIGHPQGASGAAGVVATRARACEWLSAADDQPDQSGSRLRSRFHPQRRARGPARGRALQLPRIRIEEQRAGPRARRMDDVTLPERVPPVRWRRSSSRKAGMRVRMFDRARFPRHKLCGDTLEPRRAWRAPEACRRLVARRAERSDRRHVADRSGRRAAFAPHTGAVSPVAP